MSTELGPVVVIHAGETHVFPDADAFVAWLDSQETTVSVEIQPREEVITPKSSTFWDRVHNRPADIYTPPEDRVELSPQAIQRRNAAINRQNAERLRNDGYDAAAEHWYRLADEAEAWADR